MQLLLLGVAYMQSISVIAYNSINYVDGEEDLDKAVRNLQEKKDDAKAAVKFRINIARKLLISYIDNSYIFYICLYF